MSKLNTIERAIDSKEKAIEAKRAQIERMARILADEMGREEISAASINSVLMNIATFTAEVEALQAQKRLLIDTLYLFEE